MTAQKGRDILIKIKTGENGGQNTYETMAGLRAHTLSFNSAAIDISSAGQDHAWRELLAGAGLKTMSVAGEGVFRDAQADETIRTAFVDGTIEEWLIHVPHFYDISGKFQVVSLEYAGEYNGEVNWRLSLESAGALEWAATSNA